MNASLDAIDPIDRTLRTPPEEVPTAPVPLVPPLPRDRAARGTAPRLRAASPPPIPVHALGRRRSAPTPQLPVVGMDEGAIGASRALEGRDAAARRTLAPAPRTATSLVGRFGLERYRWPLVVAGFVLSGFMVGVLVGNWAGTRGERAGSPPPRASEGVNPCAR